MVVPTMPPWMRSMSQSIKTRKRSGATPQPCLTPMRIGNHSDLEPSTLTQLVVSVQNAWYKRRILGGRPTLANNCCAFTTPVFSWYSYMELRHSRWPWLYRGRLTHWIIGALGASWIYTGRNCYQWRDTLPHWAATSIRHCSQPPSVTLWTSPSRQPSAASSSSSSGLHYGPSWQLETEGWSAQTILAQNRGGWPAANESQTSNGEMTRTGQIGMAVTCGNGHVFDKLLKKKNTLFTICHLC